MGKQDKPGGERSYTFAEWVDSIGIEVLALKLKISTQSVKNWRRGISDPKVDHMREMRRLSRGAITYDVIIDRPVLHSTYQRENGIYRGRGN